MVSADNQGLGIGRGLMERLLAEGRPARSCCWRRWPAGRFERGASETFVWLRRFRSSGDQVRTRLARWREPDSDRRSRLGWARPAGPASITSASYHLYDSVKVGHFVAGPASGAVPSFGARRAAPKPSLADPRKKRRYHARLALELRGVPCLDLEREIPNRKSIMASRSFGRPVRRSRNCAKRWRPTPRVAAEKLQRRRLATAHPDGVHRNQSLQTGRGAALARPERSTCRCDQQREGTDPRRAHRSHLDLATGAIATRKPASCCSICIRPWRCRKDCSELPAGSSKSAGTYQSLRVPA